MIYKNSPKQLTLYMAINTFTFIPIQTHTHTRALAARLYFNLSHISFSHIQLSAMYRAESTRTRIDPKIEEITKTEADS